MSALQQERLSYKSTKRKAFLWVVLGLLCFAVVIGWVRHRVKKLEAKQKVQIQKLSQKSPFFLEQLAGLPIPSQLRGIPLAEQLGIVRDIIKVDIRKVLAPYNPTLVKTSNGYDLFFRYDIPNPKLKYSYFNANIGVVSLNSQFQQQNKEFKQLDLKTNYSEDPRVLSIQNQLYLFYNQLNEETPHCRFMCVANLDPDTYEVNYRTTLDMNLQWVEKNWSPFEYIGPDQQSHLLAEYRINPRKLVELPNPQVNEIKNIPVPASAAYLNLAWAQKWGEIKGGSPCLLVDNEYLGFFHSWFIDDSKCFWYVMGAYTFAAEPPFHLTSMSTHPILFKEIYETPLINTASLNKRVIFPSGFVIEKKEGREWIYLACGENDAGIKIVVLDKEKLIHSMARFQ